MLNGDSAAEADGTNQDDINLPLIAQTGNASDEHSSNKSIDRNKKAALLFAQLTAQAESELKQKVMQKVALTDMEKKAASTLASREAMRRAQELNIQFDE